MIQLKNVLKANAASCLIFGGILASIPESTARFLSEIDTAPNLVLQILGVGLIIHGLHLLWASKQQNVKKKLIVYFSISDFIWVLMSLLLVISKIWITSKVGLTVTILVAVMVGYFGLMQWKTMKGPL
jgi:hypothetical protein